MVFGLMRNKRVRRLVLLRLLNLIRPRVHRLHLQLLHVGSNGQFPRVYQLQIVERALIRRVEPQRGLKFRPRGVQLARLVESFFRLLPIGLLQSGLVQKCGAIRWPQRGRPRANWSARMLSAAAPLRPP